MTMPDPSDQRRRPHHLREWAQRLWLPLLAAGLFTLLTALVVALINQRTASRWFGSTLADQTAAVLGGSPVNLRDLRSFLTIDAWLPSLAFLGLALVLASAASAIGLLIATMRDEGRKTQESLGHAALAPAKDHGAKLLPAFMIAGLTTIVTAFALSIARASMLSDFYQLPLAEREAATGGKLAQLGTAEALGAWLPALHIFGIGLMVAGFVFGLLAVIELHRFNGWRLRDMVSDEPQETAGELYVVTRSI